jgi:two-component system nitrate/nitrite response regulator NarL
VAFPALAGDDPLAVLSFYSLDRREPCQRMINTLAGIGSELGRFLASRRAALWPSRLSHRELQVLQLAAEGNTAPKIAEQLGVSAGTVKTHFENAYKKLGVGDRAAAVALALRSGLIC